jgi:hypothetical protein
MTLPHQDHAARRASRFLKDRATLQRPSSTSDNMGGRTLVPVTYATDVPTHVSPYRMPAELGEYVDRVEAHSRWVIDFIDPSIVVGPPIDVHIEDLVVLPGLTIRIEARQDPMTYGATERWLGSVIE